MNIAITPGGVIRTNTEIFAMLIHSIALIPIYKIASRVYPAFINNNKTNKPVTVRKPSSRSHISTPSTRRVRRIMHHTQQILPIRHHHDLMLLRAQPQQLDLIILFLLMTLRFPFLTRRADSSIPQFLSRTTSIQPRIVVGFRSVLRRMRERHAQI